MLVIRLCLSLWDPVDCTRQASLSIEFSRQEYWSGWPFPSPGHLPDLGIKPSSSTLQEILYHLSHQWSQMKNWLCWWKNMEGKNPKPVGKSGEVDEWKKHPEYHVFRPIELTDFNNYSTLLSQEANSVTKHSMGNWVQDLGVLPLYGMTVTFFLPLGCYERHHM